MTLSRTIAVPDLAAAMVNTGQVYVAVYEMVTTRNPYGQRQARMGEEAEFFDVVIRPLDNDAPILEVYPRLDAEMMVEIVWAIQHVHPHIAIGAGMGVETA